MSNINTVSYNKTTSGITTGIQSNTTTNWSTTSSGIGNTKVEITGTVKDITTTTGTASDSGSYTINTLSTVDYRSKLTASTSYSVKIGIVVTKAYWPAFFDILAWNAIHEDDPFFQIVCIAFLTDCPTYYQFLYYLNKSLARMQQDFDTKSSTTGYDYTAPTDTNDGTMSGKGGALSGEVKVLKIPDTDLSSLVNYNADLFIELADKDYFSSETSKKMITFPRIMNYEALTGSDYFSLTADIEKSKEKWAVNTYYKFVLRSPLCCFMQWLSDKFVDKILPNGPGSSRILNIRNNNIDLNTEVSNNYDPLFIDAEKDRTAASSVFPEAWGKVSCINIKATSSTLKTSANDSLFFLLKSTDDLEKLFEKMFIKKAGITNTADSVIQVISPIPRTEYPYDDTTYYLCQLNYKVNYTRYYPYTLAASISWVNQYAKKQTTTS